MKTETRFRTTAAWLTGGITGRTWMPAIQGGIPFRQNARGVWGFYEKGQGDTFRDALNSVLMNKGGDFRNALFTADTRIVIERTKVTAPGKYEVHVWERDVSALPDCADLVDEDHFTVDFMGEE